VPEVSIIIVNFKGWNRLAKCLDSLAAISDKQLSFEVIIVDNASNDGMLENFQFKYTHFHFIPNTGNNGFANGCNFGAKFAKGEYLLFLNPDTVIEVEAIIGMLTKVRKSKPNSIVSCKQIKEDGSEEKPYGKFLTPSTLTGWLRAINLILSRPEIGVVENNEFSSPDWVSGSVVLISKESYSNIGGWDEDFWMYFEDVDLCLRAREAGGDVILLKNVTVEHNHGGSSRINTHVTTLTKTEVNISRHVYTSKHVRGVKGFYMQTFLMLNNLITGLLPAVLGILFFFIKRMIVGPMIYFSLIKYYFNALQHRTWISPRSVRYRNQFPRSGSFG